MRRGLQWLLVVFVMIGSFGAPLQAQEPEKVPLTTEQEQRFHRLANELRCLVCQNQSIAESNAPLAQDLKERVRRQISEGRSDEEIKNYMRDRYGDFVLYKPPFNAVTAVLGVAVAISTVCNLAGYGFMQTDEGLYFGTIQQTRMRYQLDHEVAR